MEVMEVLVVPPMEAMKGKVLADGKLDATYTTNPATGAVVPK